MPPNGAWAAKRDRISRLRAPGFEPQGQNGFLQLLEVCPRPVLPGQADDLHGDRARAAPDLSRAEILPQGPDHGQGIDARVRIEALVLEPDEDIVETRRGTRSPGGKRHWPSAAGRAPSSRPSALKSTGETGSLKRTTGRENQMTRMRRQAAPRATSRGRLRTGTRPRCLTARSRSIVLSCWHEVRRRTSPRRRRPADNSGRDRTR